MESEAAGPRVCPATPRVSLRSTDQARCPSPVSVPGMGRQSFLTFQTSAGGPGVTDPKLSTSPPSSLLSLPLPLPLPPSLLLLTGSARGRTQDLTQARRVLFHHFVAQAQEFPLLTSAPKLSHWAQGPRTSWPTPWLWNEDTVSAGGACWEPSGVPVLSLPVRHVKVHRRRSPQGRNDLYLLTVMGGSLCSLRCSRGQNCEDNVMIKSGYESRWALDWVAEPCKQRLCKPHPGPGQF